MKIEYYLLKKVGEIFIIDASHVAYPLMSVEGLRCLFSHEERQRTISIREAGSLLSDRGFFYIHTSQIGFNQSKYYKKSWRDFSLLSIAIKLELGQCHNFLNGNLISVKILKTKVNCSFNKFVYFIYTFRLYIKNLQIDKSMDLQTVQWKKIPCPLTQNQKSQIFHLSQFQNIDSNPQKIIPSMSNNLEPTITDNIFCDTSRLKQVEPVQNIFKGKQELSSSEFSSSSSESSEGESHHENAQQKIKKITKKSARTNNYRKYSRITPEIKERLIHLIARQNMSIKQASNKLKINYSSAKFIFSQYRDRKLQIIDRDVDQRQIANDTIILQRIQPNQRQFMKLLVKCSSGGKFEAETDRTFALRQILDLYTQQPHFEPQNLKLEA